MMSQQPNLSGVTNIKKLKRRLKDFTLQEKCEILSYWINEINNEAETAIRQGNNALAIWRMAQAAMFEDVLFEYERALVKEGALL
jgi:hypothetical protein